MHPVLFNLGRWPVYSYGVMLAAAYLAAMQFAVWRGRKNGLDATKLMDFGIYIIISALLGAKLMLIITDFNYFRQQPAELLSLVRAGGVFYGGLIAAFVVGVWLVGRYKLPTWKTADMIAPGIALGHVIGRLGCFLAGCCYGKPTSEPWGIVFTDPVAASNVGTPLGVRLHPTQLYDAGAELLILIILVATERRGRPFPGRTFWAYMLAYSISRFIIEIYRNDPRGMLLGLPTSQLISLVIAPVSIYALWRLGRQARTSSATA